MKRDPNTPDLFPAAAQAPTLATWSPAPVKIPAQPPKPPGWDLRCRISRAVSKAMRESQLERDEIARRMSEFLDDEDISTNMLNQYASEASEHSVPAHRLAALAHAIERPDLLNLLTQPVGCEVVERRWLPAIEDARLTVDIEEKRARQQEVRRKWRGRS
jgi:hypothetical protein